MPGDVIADGVAQFAIRWLSGYGRLRSQRGMPWHRGIPLKYATVPSLGLVKAVQAALTKS